LTAQAVAWAKVQAEVQAAQAKAQAEAHAAAQLKSQESLIKALMLKTQRQEESSAKKLLIDKFPTMRESEYSY